MQVPAVQGLQLLVIMTEVTSFQILKLYKILRKQVGQNTVNAATAVKYKKDLTYLIFFRVKELK